MIYPVVVVDSIIKPLTHTPRPCIGVPLRGVAVRGFFVGHYKARGHHPPLVNVDATDTDKRDELALCLLGEHPSGQRQVGFGKGAAPKLNSLDKREHLSLVDNLPTGCPSGGCPMRE